MATLLWGILFGSIGMGYFIYGKKQGRFALIFSGIGLMIFPYFVSNSVIMALVGLGLMAVPYFF